MTIKGRSAPTAAALATPGHSGLGLRWLRFLWALGVEWDQATRVEARDFIWWLQVAVKPDRPHWRNPGGGAPGSGTEPAAAAVNAVGR